MSGLGFEEGGGVGSVVMVIFRLLLVVGVGIVGLLVLWNLKVVEFLNDFF